MTRSLVCAVAAGLLLSAAACGERGSTGPDAGGPDDPVTSSPDDGVTRAPGGTEPGRTGPQRVEPRAGLVDVRATRWDRHRVVEGGRAVDLFFWSGVEECYGVDRVEADYGNDRIVLTIYEGRNPAAEVCIEIAVRKVVRIALDEPVGGRKIVDGGPKG